MTLESWNTFFQLGSGVLLGFTFLFGLGAILTDRILSAERERRIAEAQKEVALAGEKIERLKKDSLDAKVDSDTRIASLNNEAEKAREGIAASKLESARANESAARAGKAAAEANRIAEEERLERLKLEAQLAPRRLSPNQRQLLAQKLKSFAKRQVSVTSYTLDAEGAVLASQLFFTLRDAGLVVEDRIGGFSPMGSFSAGVFIRGSEPDLVEGLAFALAAAGLSITISDSPFQVGGAFGDRPPFPGPVNILVGVKPIQ